MRRTRTHTQSVTPQYLLLSLSGGEGENNGT